MRNAKVSWLLVAALAVPGIASAQGKKIVGWSAIAVGTGLSFAAYNWDSSCPTGYTTHTSSSFGGPTDTACVWIGRTGSDVRDPEVSAQFARPGLLWAGIGTAALGTVLLFLPARAQKVVPSVTVTPKGVTASKSVKW
jgi:hypothetical protein